jgi:hypothetical protein
MQSPINLANDSNKGGQSSQTSQTPEAFSIGYKFGDNLKVTIQSNANEIYIHFNEFAGGLKLQFSDGHILSYAIRKLSFRFPAEHLINGYRLDGEIVLIGEEITDGDNRAIAITNGIEFAIPLQFNPKAPIYNELDDLNPDTWKQEVLANGSYVPKNSISGKLSTFN